MLRLPNRWRRPPAVKLLAAVAGLALALWLAACTSEQINPMGYELVDTEFDVVLEPVSGDGVNSYAALGIVDGDNPVTRHQVLYLGSEGGTESSILINYDFSNVYNDTFTQEMFTEDNIRSVDLRLLMLDWYSERPYDPDAKAIPKVYNVHQLTAPFDTTAIYPGPIPDYDPMNLNLDPELIFDAEPSLPLPAWKLLAWVQDGGDVGLLLKTGLGTVPSLTGFAARDLKRFGELADVDYDKAVGPALLVRFYAFSDTTLDTETTLVIKPIADTSTFDVVQAPPADPADGFIMRTCLRDYPTFNFDLSAIPANAIINRAVLAVTNDTTTSFGPLTTIVISELDTTLYDASVDTLSLAVLEANAYAVGGMLNLDPTYSAHHRLEFNVTTGVQRIVNHVYEGTRGLALCAAEDVFENFDLSTLDPDFYFTQFNFLGTSAPDSLRPRLKVTYSLVDGVNEGSTP